jgi:tetratricopeptide (TPR) repeat protein
MALLVLPAGQSLRALAERLGVPLAELLRHAAVADAEAPLPAERRIEVPDGFLRSRPPTEKTHDAVPTGTARQGGMNVWLAMEIEQKRTRAGGGLRAHGTSEDEREALGEVRRAYLRLTADDNELAVDLAARLSATHSVEVRAMAFALQGCALAQRHRLFGEPIERSRPQALSAAKAAQWADPKLDLGRLAMALALGVTRDDRSIEEARAELFAAIEQNRRAAWCWAELAALNERLGELDDASAAAAVALELEPAWVFALDTAASLAARRHALGEATALLLRAVESCPTCANVLNHLAIVTAATGDATRAAEYHGKALELCTRDAHRDRIAVEMKISAFPAPKYLPVV